MADDNTEYVRVESPTGTITTVPAEIKDVLIQSGYKEAGGRRRSTSNDQN